MYKPISFCRPIGFKTWANNHAYNLLIMITNVNVLLILNYN